MVCVKIDTKKKLEKLKCYSESYDAAIRRLIYRRNYDVVNSQVVDLEPTTPEIDLSNIEDKRGQPFTINEIKTIGK